MMIWNSQQYAGVGRSTPKSMLTNVFSFQGLEIKESPQRY